MLWRRVTAVYAALVGLFALGVCRLYLAAGNTAYAARAAGQSAVTIEMPARRGNFYDCGGQLLTGLETVCRTVRVLGIYTRKGETV